MTQFNYVSLCFVAVLCKINKEARLVEFSWINYVVFVVVLYIY